MAELDGKKAAEDLHVIRSIMEKCAARQQDDGIFLIIWGLLIPVATGINYLFAYAEKWKLIGPLWGVVMLAGAVMSAVAGKRRGAGRAATKAESLQTALWVACWGALLLPLPSG